MDNCWMLFYLNPEQMSSTTKMPPNDLPCNRFWRVKTPRSRSTRSGVSWNGWLAGPRRWLHFIGEWRHALKDLVYYRQSKQHKHDYTDSCQHRNVETRCIVVLKTTTE